MHPRLPLTDWNQLRAAYTAGGSLRGLARAAGIPAGTILARAKRESWTQLKREALDLMSGPKGNERRDISQSIAVEAGERGKRHVERMQNLCDALGMHAAAMAPGALFENVAKLSTLDLLARRSYGLESGTSGPTVNVLIGGEGGFDGPSIAFEGGEWEE